MLSRTRFCCARRIRRLSSPSYTRFAFTNPQKNRGASGRSDVENVRLEGIEANEEAEIAEFGGVADVAFAVQDVVEEILAAKRGAIAETDARLRGRIREIHNDQIPTFFVLPIVGDETGGGM